jgi:hypothetical protein
MLHFVYRDFLDLVKIMTGEKVQEKYCKSPRKICRSSHKNGKVKALSIQKVIKRANFANRRRG